LPVVKRMFRFFSSFSTLTIICASVCQAWKKIEETKKKAGDIMQVRVRNQETSKNKQQLRAQREQEEHERLERNREERLR